MKKIFKGFKLKYFILTILLAITYPIIKAFISNNKILVFSDTCFIIGLLLLLPGIFSWLSLHGDFDLTSYIAARSILRKKADSFEEYGSYEKYVESKNKQREERFNYPLFVGIIMLIISIIFSIFV